MAMKVKASAHIKAAKQGIFSHNSRENFSHSSVFVDEPNECSHTAEEAYKIFKIELGKRMKAYVDRVGQKVQKNAVKHLSMVINLLPHHTMNDLKAIIDFIQMEFDTIVVQKAIHRDEGKLVEKSTRIELYSGEQFFKHPENNKLYYDKHYTHEIDLSKYLVVRNYHAHLEMLGLDSAGAAIRHNKMNKRLLAKLQDIVAETLDMERGQKNNAYTAAEIQLIKSKLKKKYLYNSDQEYAQEFNRVAREIGIFKGKRKRYDTHPFKKIGTIQQEKKLTEIGIITKKDIVAFGKLKEYPGIKSLDDIYFKHVQLIKKNRNLKRDNDVLRQLLQAKSIEIEHNNKKDLQEKIILLEEENLKLNRKIQDLEEKLKPPIEDNLDLGIEKEQWQSSGFDDNDEDLDLDLDFKL